MKFRMFTDAETKLKIAVNIDKVRVVYETDGTDGTDGTDWPDGTRTVICMDGKEDVCVAEDYDVVLSRLNIIAE